MTGQPHINAPVDLVLEAGHFRLTLPDWGRWLDILDRAARGQDSTDRADPDRLLQGWIAATVQQADGAQKFRPIPRIADLPAVLADRLMAAGTEALESQREDLNLQVATLDDGATVSSHHHSFTLHPLSFSARNTCLRDALVLQADGPQINASLYELTLVARSTTDTKNGAPVSIPTLRALPLVIGEALITQARRLSDPAADAELHAFAEAGLQHPDLELASLCLTFGLSPDAAGSLPAATAKRLNAAARLLAASTPQPAQHTPTAPIADNVTQIVINDD